MTREEEQTRRKELHNLLDLVLDINGMESRQRKLTGSRPTAFFSFFGNVCSADISINEGGWVDGVPSDCNTSMYFDGELYDREKVLSVTHYLNELRSGLEANQP